MCSALSCAPHGHPVWIPWHVPPQPVLEASEVITRFAVDAGMCSEVHCVSTNLSVPLR